MALGLTARRSTGRGIRGERRTEMLTGLAFVFIPLLLYVFLYFGAMVYAAYISLWRWGLRGATRVLGLENYQRRPRRPDLLEGGHQHPLLRAIWVPLTMALGLFLAVIVNERIRGRTFFRAAFYFPTLASSAAITVVWIFLLQPEGLFNAAREVLGLNPLFAALGYDANFNWLGNSRTAMNAIILLNAWTTSGTIMLFYLTFLQTISREIYEAAAIDGRHVADVPADHVPAAPAGPLLRRHRCSSSADSSCSTRPSSRAAGGEPSNSLTTIVLFIYRSAITDSEFGYAAAVGLVLFVLIFTLTLIQRRLFGEAPSW